MSQPDPARPTDQGGADHPPTDQPAGLPRASSTAVIVRENDLMRAGVDAAVLNVSMEFLSLATRGDFALEEQIKIRLRNVVQRFEKEARGAVRKIETGDGGSTILGVELLTRLSPLEVSLVKMGIPSSHSPPKWV